jgi:hypothetical protein
VPFALRAENVAAADAAADIFLLSGSEDLVPITAADAPWTAYREVSGYFVRAFRPRIEGTFSRIESWTRIADGDTHWRTISRDNVLTVYGETLASRIADPEDAQCIFEWLICRSYDDRGNAIEYEYAAEGDDGIDITRASERLRSRSANSIRRATIIFHGRRSIRKPDGCSKSCSVMATSHLRMNPRRRDSNVCAGRTIGCSRGTRVAIHFRERAPVSRFARIDYASEFSSRIACRSGLGPRERSYVTFSSITTPDRSAHVWRASRNPDIGHSKKDCIGVGPCHRCC